jgi:hypothetical protein
MNRCSRIINALMLSGYTVPVRLFCGLIMAYAAGCNVAQGQVNVVKLKAYDSFALVKQQQALNEFEKLDTISSSPFWPEIKPAFFFANLRNNLMYPDKINQGAATNFCGYAAMTHLLVKYNAVVYLQQVVSIYREGYASLERKTLKPSPAVREAAGSLVNKGRLDLLHADQMWFLTLADQFKGYMNIIDHKYQYGDENKIWAGTNYAKFNRMLKHFTRFRLAMKGSDFIRPVTGDFYTYINSQLGKGVVLLYVNSKFLYPHKFTVLKLRAPTHFIVLYDMEKIGELIKIRYWDYGLKTEQLITRKRLKKLIFGVTTISNVRE